MMLRFLELRDAVRHFLSCFKSASNSVDDEFDPLTDSLDEEELG
jgi:hypothetical protein